MITPHDVPASKLIEKLARYLRENVDEVQPPVWATMVKTGSHVEKPPQDPAWWFTRCASIFRKIYVHGPIGAEKLRASYGGAAGYRSKPEHASKSGGTIVRKAMQQLQVAGLIEVSGTKGRIVTKQGRAVLQEMAEGLSKELAKENPELSKYRKG